MLGTELKRERLRSGLSPEAAAKRANVDPSLLLALEEETEGGLGVHLVAAERIANVYAATIVLEKQS